MEACYQRASDIVCDGDENVVREDTMSGTTVRVDDFTLMVVPDAIVFGDRVHIPAIPAIRRDAGVEMGVFCAFSPGARLLTGNDHSVEGVVYISTVPARFRSASRAPISWGRFSDAGATALSL